MLDFAQTLIDREINAATDNPFVVPDETAGYVVLSGGGFHGEPLAYAADLITMAIAEIGRIAERRSFRLLDPTLSDALPLNLVGATLGLNTGFSLVHGSAAASVSENEVLSYPCVVDSILTKAIQQDHVSMSRSRHAQHSPLSTMPGARPKTMLSANPVRRPGDRPE